MEQEQGEKIPTPSIKTYEELLKTKEIRQIGGAIEIKFTDLSEEEIAALLTKPIGEDMHVGAEIRTAKKERYNEGKPINIGNMTVMPVREEPVGTEDSDVRWFEYDPNSDTGHPLSDTEDLESCQDPSYQGEIKDEKYISVVKTIKIEGQKDSEYCSQLFKLNPKLKNLEKVAESPRFAKGLHIAEYKDGIIGVVRMQREEYGRGKICFFTAPSPDGVQDVMDNLREKTQIIEMFHPDEWGGINDLLPLEDGRFLAVGHIARLRVDENNVEHKEYAITTAYLNPETRELTDLKIVMTMDDLKDADGGLVKDKFPPKKPILENVIYPTNAELEGNRLTIYAGAKDALPYKFTVEYNGPPAKKK